MASIRCRRLLSFCVSLSILAVGCNLSKPGSGTGNLVSLATPQTTTTQVAGQGSPLPKVAEPVSPEKYHSVNSATAGVSFMLGAEQMEWNSGGSLTTCAGCTLKAVDAHGHSMPIVLTSKVISNGGINTRDFGIIKVRFAHAGGFSMSGEYLMQDSHLKDLQQKLRGIRER
jgi:hypothetical protein